MILPVRDGHAAPEAIPYGQDGNCWIPSGAEQLLTVHGNKIFVAITKSRVHNIQCMV